MPSPLGSVSHRNAWLPLVIDFDPKLISLQSYRAAPTLTLCEKHRTIPCLLEGSGSWLEAC